MEASAKPCAVLADMVVDKTTWGRASRPRQIEWQSVIDDLISIATFSVGDAVFSGLQQKLHGQLCILPEAVVLTLTDGTGREAGRLVLGKPVLLPMVRDYLRLLSDIESSCRSVSSSHLEALDIARRLAHDDAADLLLRSFSGVQPDKETARQLFSLLVLLTQGTSRLLS